VSPGLHRRALVLSYFTVGYNVAAQPKVHEDVEEHGDDHPNPAPDQRFLGLDNVALLVEYP